MAEMVELVCPQCDKVFEREAARVDYKRKAGQRSFCCSPLCARRNWKPTAATKWKMSESAKGNKKFLGKAHSTETRNLISQKLKGHPVSYETRSKISEGLAKAVEAGKKPGHHVPHSAKTRRKISEAKKGCAAWNVGKTLGPLSEETKRKLSEANSGANSPLWLGGKSFEPYGLGFTRWLRREVRKRDNYTCQVCGHIWTSGERSLCVHHVDYDKDNNAIGNLVSSCLSCHTKTNYNRDDWLEYFANKGFGVGSQLTNED